MSGFVAFRLVCYALLGMVLLGKAYVYLMIIHESIGVRAGGSALLVPILFAVPGFFLVFATYMCWQHAMDKKFKVDSPVEIVDKPDFAYFNELDLHTWRAEYLCDGKSGVDDSSVLAEIDQYVASIAHPSLTKMVAGNKGLECFLISQTRGLQYAHQSKGDDSTSIFEKDDGTRVSIVTSGDKWKISSIRIKE
jgi:hypothetical protein